LWFCVRSSGQVCPLRAFFSRKEVLQAWKRAGLKAPA
jgi:hypothetical protein